MSCIRCGHPLTDVGCRNCQKQVTVTERASGVHTMEFYSVFSDPVWQRQPWKGSVEWIRSYWERKGYIVTVIKETKTSKPTKPKKAKTTK